MAEARADGRECRPAKPTKPERTTAEIQKDIQDTIRQIVSSVTFLPVVEEKCESDGWLSGWGRPANVRRSTGVFNILVYTDLNTEVPLEWVDSDPHMISGNAEQVRRTVVPSCCVIWTF